MSSLQEIWTSRVNQTAQQDAETGNIGTTFVGQEQRLWYNPDTNAVYVYGNVPGGVPVGLDPNSNISINRITANSGLITGNLTIVGNISPASNVKIGGVKAGPGANISNDGTLTINTAGLAFSFGDFTANNNILTLVNVDQNMVLATQGNAEIQLVGNIGFYKSNGLPPDPNNLFFFAKDDGQITIFVPAEDPLLGAVEIIGSSTGNLIPPGQPGAMLHVTGQLEIPCRIYYDGNGDYVSWIARRWNGNVANPTQVLAGEDVLRINATAATNLGGGNVGNVAMAQISVMALENQTATAQGSEIAFTVTPVGQPATNRVDVATITVANGVSATKFTTAGTVSATGNIDGGNVRTAGVVTATGNVTGGNILTGGVISAASTITSSANITGGNILTSGVISATLSITSSANITGGNILASGLISATGNITGGNISATNHTGTTVSVTGNITGGNISAVNHTGSTVSVSGNITGGNIATAGQISATGNITGGNVLTGGLISATGNITAGNVAATNYTGLVTHSSRDAGDVDGATVTLNMTTDDIVRCTFAGNGMTVAFSNIIPGRIVTLLAVKTDGGTDNINTGVTSQNMSNGDNTAPVNGPCTAVLTYYSLGTTTGNIFCQIVSAT